MDSLTKAEPAILESGFGKDLNDFKLLQWLWVIGVNAYDLLALANLAPTHTLHTSRPYLVSPTKFPVFQLPRQPKAVKR